MHRERVRECGRLEIDVQAPRQCKRRVAVDVPLAGPVTLQPDFVREPSADCPTTCAERVVQVASSVMA